MMSTHVRCKVCERDFKQITNTHLRSHGLTVSSYLVTFPTARIVSDELSAEAAKRTSAANTRRDYSTVGAKISATKRQLFAEGKLKVRNGFHLSEKQRQQLSALAKKRAASGNHSRIGAKLSTDTKALISDSLRKTLGPAAQARTAAREKQRALKFERASELQASTVREKQARLELESITWNGTVTGDRIKLACQRCRLDWTYSDQYLDDCRFDKISCPSCRETNKSREQTELVEALRGIYAGTIEVNNREVLGGKEIDVWIPDLRVGFEYNGLYWHSDRSSLSPRHLLWKQQHAFNEGARLYHIFSDEWLSRREIVLDRLRHILRSPALVTVGARESVLREVTSQEHAAFMRANHLQGNGKSSVRLGLVRDSELISVMSFARTSIAKGGDGKLWELSRFAVKLNHNVPGAASKLLREFTRRFSGQTVISYADRRWSFGDLYSKLGFKFTGLSAPSYWYTKNYQQRIHRAAFMKHRLVAAGGDPKLTEWEIMQDLGYDRIWDCGTTRWLLTT